jgi:hypothetical protein
VGRDDPHGGPVVRQLPVDGACPRRAASAFDPGTDVVVTFVVFHQERKVRILAVEDIPS